MSSEYEFRRRPAELSKKLVVSLQDAVLCKICFGVCPAVFAEPLAERRSGTQRAGSINQGTGILGGRHDSTVRPADMASRFASLAYGRSEEHTSELQSR